MSEDDSNEKAAFLKLVSTLESALKEGPWDKGLLLQAMGKKLRDFHKELTASGKHWLDEEQEKMEHSAQTPKKVIAPREGMELVYISLYCSNGAQLERWESILHTLAASIISRPIYAKETDIKENIAQKKTPANEGYCAVWIDKSEITKPFTGESPRDKLGHELLVLKRGSIDLNHIQYFVHQDKRYTYEAGRLVFTEAQRD